MGGVFADKKNRKKLLIYTDILSGIVTLIVYLNYSSKKAWNLIVVNIILAILYSFNSPAYKAIIKDLLSKKNIYKYNSYS
ncbi:MFS transporter [Lactobacillus huangpiensis]